MRDSRQTQGSNEWTSIPGGGAGRRFNWYAIFRGRTDAESAQAASAVR